MTTLLALFWRDLRPPTDPVAWLLFLLCLPMAAFASLIWTMSSRCRSPREAAEAPMDIRANAVAPANTLN